MCLLTQSLHFSWIMSYKRSVPLISTIDFQNTIQDHIWFNPCRTVWEDQFKFIFRKMISSTGKGYKHDMSIMYLLMLTYVPKTYKILSEKNPVKSMNRTKTYDVKTMKWLLVKSCFLMSGAVETPKEYKFDTVWWYQLFSNQYKWRKI